MCITLCNTHLMRILMGTRSVRLDDDTEKTLLKLTKMTGLSLSEVFKRGVMSIVTRQWEDAAREPYAIYKRLDLGDGGYAVATARDAKNAVVDAIRKKHGPVILVDTGPLVALFDPADASHCRCVDVLKSIQEPIGTPFPFLPRRFTCCRHRVLVQTD